MLKLEVNYVRNLKLSEGKRKNCSNIDLWLHMILGSDLDM